MAEKRSSTLWRNAIPLKRAWLESAPADRRDEYDAVFAGITSREDAQSLEKDAGFWRRLGFAILTLAEAYGRRRTIETELQQSLIKRISAGEFELLGFRLEPNPSRGPVIIAATDVGRFRPDWANESIYIRDEVYVDLRVSPSDRRGPGAKRGRPGSSDIIAQAIAELAGAPESTFCSQPRKQACELVREFLRNNQFDVSQSGSGLSNGNISKLILDYCPQKKVHRKK